MSTLTENSKDNLSELFRTFNKYHLDKYKFSVLKANSSALIYIDTIEFANFTYFLTSQFIHKSNIHSDISLIDIPSHTFFKKLSLIFICETIQKRVDPNYFIEIQELNPNCKIVLISILNTPPARMESYIDSFISLSASPNELFMNYSQLLPTTSLL